MKPVLATIANTPCLSASGFATSTLVPSNKQFLLSVAKDTFSSFSSTGTLGIGIDSPVSEASFIRRSPDTKMQSQGILDLF